MSDISPQLETIGRKHVRASGIVTIDDDTGAAVGGATIQAAWSGLTAESQSGTTDGSGQAIFRSPKVSNSQMGEFVFAVTDVVVSGFVYDPAANVETSACIDTSGAECSTEPGDLPPPSNISATASGDTVTVSWSQVNGATGYGVYRRVGGTGDFLLQGTTADTTYVDLGLSTGTYQYVVTTLDSVASYESGFSDVASATVSDGMPTALHVSGIAVTVANKGKNWSGSATVTILDADNAPASNAVVSGQWTHEPLGGSSADLNQVAGNTDINGRFITTSSKLRALSGDSFRFTVNDVSRGGDTYDPGSSVETDAAVVP